MKEENVRELAADNDGQQLLQLGYVSSSSQKRQRRWGLREARVTNTMISYRFALANYRVQAGRTTGCLVYDARPSLSSAASSGNNNPHAWLGWDQHPHSHQNQHRQQIRPDAFS
jgi:hypothetical protein